MCDAFYIVRTFFTRVNAAQCIPPLNKPNKRRHKATYTSSPPPNNEVFRNNKSTYSNVN